MNAMRGSYELDKSQYKDMIGNLNWKKFADRIQNQLTSNINLTIEQKQLMEVNAIVALLLSHQFPVARQMWEKIRKVNKHSAIKGIGVYFALKDKKSDKALEQVANETDTYSVFLRAQILLNDKKPKEAFESLVSAFQDEQVKNAGYTNLLLRTATALEIEPKLLQGVNKAIQKNISKVEPSVVLQLSKYFETMKMQEEAVKVLFAAYKNHKDDLRVQARYLTVLADVDFAEAEKLQ